MLNTISYETLKDALSSSLKKKNIRVWINVVCLFLCTYRLWIWKLLQCRGASVHMVWQPALRCPRSVWRERVRRAAAGHLGKLAEWEYWHNYSIQHSFSSYVNILLFAILFTESGSGTLCSCLWLFSIWWTRPSCTQTKSHRGTIQNPFLYVSRYNGNSSAKEIALILNSAWIKIPN